MGMGITLRYRTLFQAPFLYSWGSNLLYRSESAKYPNDHDGLKSYEIRVLSNQQAGPAPEACLRLT